MSQKFASSLFKKHVMDLDYKRQSFMVDFAQRISDV